MFFFKRKNDAINELAEARELAGKYKGELSLYKSLWGDAIIKLIDRQREIDRQSDLIAVLQSEKPVRDALGRFASKGA